MRSAAIETGSLVAERFRLGQRIERDWRGDLYAATDERSGGPCEVELIRVAGKQEEQLLRLVEREVEIGEMWLHDVPDVLRAIAWSQLGPGEVIIARELIPEAKPLEPAGDDLDARVWQVLSAAQAVAELHGRGIVHRDLGPRALLTAADGTVHVARFALARLDEVAEPWAGPLGLPLLHLRCAAPEVFLRPSEADVRADVYALGSLLFRTIVGRWPYAGPSLAQIVQQQQAVLHKTALPPTETAGVPASLRKACAKALAPAPEERYGRVSELIDAIEAWLAVDPAERSADDTESDLGALDLTGDEDEPPPLEMPSGGPIRADYPSDLVVIETTEDGDEALEHSAMEGSEETWAPEIAEPPPMPAAISAPPPPPARTPTPPPLPRPTGRQTPPPLPRPTTRTPAPMARPEPAVAEAEPASDETDLDHVEVPPDTEAVDDEPMIAVELEDPPPEAPPEPVELRPVEEVLPEGQRVGAAVLVPGAPARELTRRIDALRRADLSSFLGVVIDLRGVANLGGTELEALTGLKMLAEAREVEAGLMGVGRSVLHILTLMDMTPNVPRLLAAPDPEAAARELLEGA